MTYKQYINSRAWKAKRRQFLTEHLKYCRCFCCRDDMVYGKDIIHIHHHHYRNFKYEKMSDLSALCQGCHAKVHRLNRTFKINLDKCHITLRRIVRKKSNLTKTKKLLAKSSSFMFSKFENTITSLEIQLKPFDNL